jgi:SAM-dependent methyltransferase
MYITLEQSVIKLLCCPLCKGKLSNIRGEFICGDCSTIFPSKTVSLGNHEENVYDFRIIHPPYCIPDHLKKWQEVQDEYIKCCEDLSKKDDLESYLGEIDSVKEIYTKEFNISGSVLDVGGHQGRLRHYLLDGELNIYVSLDPLLDVFDNIQSQKNLLIAYPCLSDPCNFLAGYAENLPFMSSSFDWVHMRSVIDHFVDPLLALKEAFRVLKPGGRIMIGLAIIENIPYTSKAAKIASLIKDKGILAAIALINSRILNILKYRKTDDHNIRLSYSQLLDLLAISGFTIEKIHWQKPPYGFCVYVSAIKNTNKYPSLHK